MHDERARQAPTSQRNKNPDSLSIALKDAPGAGSREIVAGLVVDLDANGDVVGFDIDFSPTLCQLSLSSLTSTKNLIRESADV
ncbi:DUF2283 domain-containing protein [Tardiphaga sp. 839_C3_N1_4]|uniref:DUF2283 domain-containing protein n=1 Tax=Tardiphaga sp. 839_C3_N1_4 TaxID=3240761 RepID=UPI003F226F7C